MLLEQTWQASWCSRPTFFGNSKIHQNSTILVTNYFSHLFSILPVTTDTKFSRDSQIITDLPNALRLRLSARGQKREKGGQPNLSTTAGLLSTPLSQDLWNPGESNNCCGFFPCLRPFLAALKGFEPSPK